jgi:dTDP-4-dehydrorhamnose 3,5-epimerase
LTRGAINGKRGDMKFTPTPLRGALIIDIEPIADDRGYFSYLYCARQAAEHGIARTVAQVKLSYNKRKGTVRGMHYQVPPAAER